MDREELQLQVIKRLEIIKAKVLLYRDSDSWYDIKRDLSDIVDEIDRVVFGYI